MSAKEFWKAMLCYLFHRKVMAPVSDTRFGRYVLTRSVSMCPMCEVVEGGRIVRMRVGVDFHAKTK